MGGKLFLKERAKDGRRLLGKKIRLPERATIKAESQSVMIIVVIHPERYRNRKVLGMTRDP